MSCLGLFALKSKGCDVFIYIFAVDKIKRSKFSEFKFCGCKKFYSISKLKTIIVMTFKEGISKVNKLIICLANMATIIR